MASVRDGWKADVLGIGLRLCNVASVMAEMADRLELRHTFALLGIFALPMPQSASAGVPVEVVGNTAADNTLQHDILQTITYYGAAFQCSAPSRVRASMLNASMIPSDAAYRAPSLKASYEEWDATFCGKTYRFFVKFWPDPQGGSFLMVSYPYPTSAPSAISH